MGSSASSPLGCSKALKQANQTGVEEDDDLLSGRDREEDIAQFPYVEFTGRDSITCPSCQGTGCIPTEQVNELVALIPYSDQRLQPQRTKLYVVLSVLLCLLICGLVVFFLFPRSVIVEDGGTKMVKVWFDTQNKVITLAMTSALHIKNANFYSVSVNSLISQVQYMSTVIGTEQKNIVTLIQPLSDKLVDFTVKLELGGTLSYLYNFCTLPSVKVHNIVVFMRTSLKFSYIGHVSQSSLESYQYIDCGANSTITWDHSINQ
ncbi:transmembrane protein 106C [Spea bombifrons]|uniref:transmembrane protein 106C n=1 Tax=Spea bombifrons TaxID=233779 RepID=UPI00234AF85D|nr:transmembrane protein 106C [Spea bombifrons]